MAHNKNSEFLVRIHDAIHSFQNRCDYLRVDKPNEYDKLLAGIGKDLDIILTFKPARFDKIRTYTIIELAIKHCKEFMKREQMPNNSILAIEVKNLQKILNELKTYQVVYGHIENVKNLRVSPVLPSDLKIKIDELYHLLEQAMKNGIIENDKAITAILQENLHNKNNKHGASNFVRLRAYLPSLRKIFEIWKDSTDNIERLKQNSELITKFFELIPDISDIINNIKH